MPYQQIIEIGVMGYAEWNVKKGKSSITCKCLVIKAEESCYV